MHVLGVVFGPLCSPVYIETLISGFWLEGGPGQGQSQSLLLYCLSCAVWLLHFRFASHHLFNRAVASLVCRVATETNWRTKSQRPFIHSWVVPALYANVSKHRRTASMIWLSILAFAAATQQIARPRRLPGRLQPMFSTSTVSTLSRERTLKIAIVSG